MNIDYLKTMRVYINQRGISQKEFGKRVGLSTDRTTRLLLKRHNLNDNDIAKLKAFFEKEGVPFQITT